MAAILLQYLVVMLLPCLVVMLLIGCNIDALLGSEVGALFGSDVDPALLLHLVVIFPSQAAIARGCDGEILLIHAAFG